MFISAAFILALICFVLASAIALGATATGYTQLVAARINGESLSVQSSARFAGGVWVLFVLGFSAAILLGSEFPRLIAGFGGGD